MSICVFCDEMFFKDPHWMANNSQKKSHHSSADEWAKSVYSTCTICTLLASRAKELWRGDSAHTSPVSIGVDSDIDTLRWLEEHIGMPIFEGTLLRLSDSDGFLITFRPSTSESTTTPKWNRELGVSLCGCQSFNICPIDRGKIELPPANMVSRQTCMGMLAYDPLAWPSYNDPHLGAGTSLDAQVRQWVRDCDTHHVTCRVTSSTHSQISQLPVRLLAIGKKDFTHVHLIETFLDAVAGPYTTLSYCWGRNQKEHPPKLTSHSLEGYKNRISFNILPKTFKEAIELTAALNVYYIWIDSLCILQDDHGQDFQRQAPNMVRIYGGSYCNIAAANSRNCSQGLYRTLRSQQPAKVLPAWNSTNEYQIIIRSDLWESELLDEPLYSRAWVLQERLLARRVLHYAAGQLFWQCRNLTACSSLPEGYPSVLDEAPRTEREWMRLLSYQDKTNDKLQILGNSKHYRAWRAIVQEYTSCELSRSSDKLPAIYGVAEAISYATGDIYCAGLWTSDLVEQLAWKVRSKLPMLALPRDKIPYRAPSWAWPSVDGVIELPKRLSTTRNYSVKVLELLTSPPSTVPDGISTAQTSLRLRGHVFQLVFVLRPGNDSQHWTWLHKYLMETHNAEFVSLHADDDLFRHMGELDWRSDDEEHNNEILYKTPYTATVLMCAYSCRWERRHASSIETGELYSGHGLAIEYNETSSTWSRVGLVNFQNLSQNLWNYLQDRQMTPQGDRPLKTEDFDSIEGHTITLT